MLQCTVCKSRQSGKGGGGGAEKQHFDPNFPDLDEDSGGSGAGNRKKWMATKDRTSVSQMRLNYKLFDCLKREFNEGFVCNECTDLVEQIDSLQFQANELIKDLRNRVDMALYDGDLSDEPRPLPSSGRWRGTPTSATTTPSIRKRPKRELDIDDEDDTFEAFEPALDDPDYIPTASSGGSQVKVVKIKKEAAGGSTGSASKKASTPKVHDPFKRVIQYKNEFWDKCNDPEYVEGVLKKKNYDYDLTVITTITNNEHLIYDGAIWHAATFRGFSTDKYLFKWICGKSHHFSYRCTARVATTADKQCVIQESRYMEHNHELDPDEVKHSLLKNRVKEIAINHPEMTPIRVLKTVEMMNEDMTGIKMAQSSILKYITRIQDKHGIPRKPREAKPGYVPRKRKTPLTKWKKTPSQLKREAEEEARRKLEEEEGEESESNDAAEQSEDAAAAAAVSTAVAAGVPGSQQVQHIIIQQGGDSQLIVQSADGSTGAGATPTSNTTSYTHALPAATTFQIEYTGHVAK